MNKSVLKITNDREEPIFVQIDTWADFLYLIKGESITLAAYPEDNQDVIFEVSEDNGSKTIWIPNNSEYFFIEGNEEINHMDYGSNVEGWTSPLHSNSSLKSSIKYSEVNPNYYANKDS